MQNRNQQKKNIKIKKSSLKLLQKRYSCSKDYNSYLNITLIYQDKLWNIKVNNQISFKDLKNRINQIFKLNNDSSKENSQNIKQNQFWLISVPQNYLLDYRIIEQIGNLDYNAKFKIVRPVKNDYNKNNIPKKLSQLSQLSQLIEKNEEKNKLRFHNHLNRNSLHSLKTAITQQSQSNRLLSNYSILKCISVGGFSKVYLIRSYVNGKFYVGKFIEKQKQKSNEKQNLIRNERQINQQISHPLIVKMYQFIETQHFYVFILEYCPGGELFHQLKKFVTISENQAKIYFIQILLGIEYLHSKNIIFRDIKLQNILLNANGHAKLADFGLAKKLLSKKQRSYSYCGSLEYMAPQIVLKISHSFQADYYSLGVLLYEIIVGYPPFYNPQKSVQQIKQRIINQEIKFPNQLELSNQIKDIILKLLQKNPNNRLGHLGGTNQILYHPWIGKINRKQILNGQIIAPLIPNLNILNFDETQLGCTLNKFTKKIIQDIRLQKYQHNKIIKKWYQNSKNIIKDKSKEFKTKYKSLGLNEKMKDNKNKIRNISVNNLKLVNNYKYIKYEKNNQCNHSIKKSGIYTKKIFKPYQK